MAALSSRDLSMFHIALYEPQIAPNTGNIIRLMANNSSHLHLIEPLGFDLEAKKLRRAGLDYRDMTSVGDVLLFGSETAGLPQSVMDSFAPAHRLRIPMRPGCRSMNLSNAVAIVSYEAWRQNDFAGGQ